MSKSVSEKGQALLDRLAEGKSLDASEVVVLLQELGEG
jgi:hypothetical protein